jgi:hypothetical protein
MDGGSSLGGGSGSSTSSDGPHPTKPDPVIMRARAGIITFLTIRNFIETNFFLLFCFNTM